MATFVLVHGAFHGGWCYSRVSERLIAFGHTVYAPTLTGLAERAHLATPMVNLSTHIDDVVDVITGEDLNDVILCGHSYAGMVITGVADRIAERIKTLFYLDAAVPTDGKSLFELRGEQATLAALAAAGETGWLVPSLSAQAFGVNPDDAEWVDQNCTPHPIACFIERLRLSGREALVAHRTYVRAERYASPAVGETYDRIKQDPQWRVVALDCGHDVMIDAPEELANLLLQEVER
ncbi:alpha/beta hydrolase [Sphingomonas crocodyli]|uniref:Alpha/beta hydrolase n=2 Tax=Sphingomonas crocodyli TaxID=1979270 RepID=A0A437MBT0_9SPHN|nr:alpha/beta hydrolase [Sphingomonas crocodyli]